MSAVMPNPGSSAAAAAAPSAYPAANSAIAGISQPAEAVPSASDRLARSREQMRDAMLAITHPPPRLSATGEPIVAGSLLDPLFNRLLAVPGVNIVVDTVQNWWRFHPWRAVATVAADAGREAVGPIARRHPVYLMLGAALFGALLLRWGPWRWAARRTVLAGIVPVLATRLAAHVPVQSWLSALAMLRRTKADPATRHQEVPRT